MKNIATLVDDSTEKLRDHIARSKSRSGFALSSYFYRSHLVYENELSGMLFKSWLYAAHVSEIPNAGDFVLFEIGEDSIIITRDKEGDVHALMNICRHRGARVCEKTSGNQKTFVCPYHAWTYNLDGSLRSARHMNMLDGFDQNEFGLKKANIAIFHGLIFVNCDPGAGDALSAFSKIEAQIAGYELGSAKIAHKETYRIDANWKLCLENYLECYHCATAHKDYARMHTLEDIGENVAGRNEAMRARAPEITGIPGIADQYQKIYLKAESFGACASAWRYGLYDGYQTGSYDGQPVAPLMGKFKGYDGGAGDFHFGPVTFMLNYPDHCVLYRFIPRSLTSTDMQIVWFVNGDAREGTDYDPENVKALWHNTSLEDKYIITRNSEGVNSQFFEPGPFHPEFEDVSMKFVEWYLDTLEKSVSG